MRATHAKATGFLKGKLVVADDLPRELAQGSFARPGRYDVLVRYSRGRASRSIPTSCATPMCGVTTASRENRPGRLGRRHA